MQKNFDYQEITSKAYNYLKEEFSYKYVTLRHYRSRWLPVKEYIEKHGLEYISPAVCKDFLFEFYKGRTHEELTEKEKLIEKSVSVLSQFMQTGSVQQSKHTVKPLFQSFIFHFILAWKNRHHAQVIRNVSNS